MMNAGTTAHPSQRIEDSVKQLQKMLASLKSEEREPLQHKLNAAYNRYKDDKLNLAIIGEFSCGKSTFINALFRQNLLATATQPTTAVPTYITWDNGKNTYDVVVYDENEAPYCLNDRADRRSFELRVRKKLHVRKDLPLEAEKRIDAVTTDNALRDVISRVEISAPRREEYDGIRLIDTPGVNPGGEETREHVHITQTILRDAADATVVMFPADEVFTASFKEFLQENAAHLLKHSIFLITKADHVRQEKELDELIAFVAHHLTEMGVENPEVQCISAFSALAVYLNVAEEREKPWKDKFEATVGGIFQSLARRRMWIVSQNIQEVVEQLKRLLQERFATEKGELQKIQEELERNSPEKMKEECKELYQAYQWHFWQEHKAYADRIDEVVSNAICEVKREINRRVDVCRTKEAVSEKSGTFSNLVKEMMGGSLNAYIQECYGQMEKKYSEYCQKLQKCYEKYHLAIATKSTLQLETPKDTQVEIERINVKSPILLTSPSGVMRAVLGDGALIDPVPILFPMIGMLGVSFRVLQGVGNLFKPLDEIKTEVKVKTWGEVDKQQEGLRNSLKKAIGDCYQRYADFAEQLPEKLSREYANEFNTAREKYEEAIENTHHNMRIVEEKLRTLRTL